MPNDERARAAALITGCWSTQVIHAAVKLGVVDALADAPAHAGDIAARLGLHPRSTFRLLRAMAGLGLAEHQDAELFALTPTGRVLCTDAEDSVRAMALHWGGRTWEALGQLESSVRTGKAFRDSGREGFFSMKDKPELAAVFNASMALQTGDVADAIAEAYDFADARDVIDLGGGYGALLAAVLKRFAHLTGGSADLAYMQAPALAYLKDAGVGERARYLPTDFFEAVPAGADVYLLKFIIHDWEDADALAILANTAAAAGGLGKVLVIERLAPARAAADPADIPVLRGDVQMLASAGGVERTEPEYDALFAAAGLRRTRTISTASAFCILEAVAAERA